MNKIEQRYHDGSYLRENPTWDREDSPWKAAMVVQAFYSGNLSPASVCEIGCGAGDVLAELRDKYPDAELCGYDISPQAAPFWREHKGKNIEFHQGDFFSLDNKTFEVLLLLDIIEHLRDPFGFLERLHGRAKYFIFHIPLDLSAFSVLRETPLLYVRNKVGHIHYYTKSLALSMLDECGYNIIDWRYTGAAIKAPAKSLKTWLAVLPRVILNAINKDLSVRMLGGETLLVVARSK